MDPARKAFGAKIEISFKNGESFSDEMAVANAHPAGAKPFTRPNYEKKFLEMSEGFVSKTEADRFFGLVRKITQLTPTEVLTLNPILDVAKLERAVRDTRGIF